jgi:hypothetical protein
MVNDSQQGERICNICWLIIDIENLAKVEEMGKNSGIFLRISQRANCFLNPSKTSKINLKIKLMLKKIINAFEISTYFIKHPKSL